MEQAPVHLFSVQGDLQAAGEVGVGGGVRPRRPVLDPEVQVGPPGGTVCPQFGVGRTGVRVPLQQGLDLQDGVRFRNERVNRGVDMEPTFQAPLGDRRVLGKPRAGGGGAGPLGQEEPRPGAGAVEVVVSGDAERIETARQFVRFGCMVWVQRVERPALENPLPFPGIARDPLRTERRAGEPEGMVLKGQYSFARFAAPAYQARSRAGRARAPRKSAGSPEGRDRPPGGTRRGATRSATNPDSPGRCRIGCRRDAGARRVRADPASVEFREIPLAGEIPLAREVQGLRGVDRGADGDGARGFGCRIPASAFPERFDREPGGGG